jgi:hypothetical protein
MLIQLFCVKKEEVSGFDKEVDHMKVIETERLLLRPFTLEDVDGVFQVTGIARDPRSSRRRRASRTAYPSASLLK